MKQVFVVVILVFFLTALLVLNFYSPEPVEGLKLENGKLTNVVRILEHQPGKFSFYMKIPDQTKLDTQVLSAKIHNYYIDVPVSENNWVSLKGNRRVVGNDVSWDEIDIHIHNPEEINGGAWSNGKSGSGQTNVIQ